jgi:hypothetical protein
VSKVIGVGEETRKSTTFRAFRFRKLIAGGKEEMTRYLSISISVRGRMALSWTRVASDFSDFSCRDTGEVGTSLELGRLFHIWGHRAVVSVGVCMVIDLQLIPRSNPKLVPRSNPTKSPDNDRHRSFISTRCSRCCSWARGGVGVTREDVQGGWYIGPLCRFGRFITHYRPQISVRVVAI